jgi:predicted DNA-binding transcriptional regulator AlpA
MTQQHRPDQNDHEGESDIMTLAEVAAFLRVPEATLRYWRHLSIGPDSFKIGRSVRYQRNGVLDWLRAQQASGRGPNAA